MTRFVDSWKLKATKKSAILLLAVLVILLAVSFLPFGSDNSGSVEEKAALNEKTILLQRIQEFNNLPPAVDVKIEPVVKEEAKEALYLAAAAKGEKERLEKGKVEVLVKSSGRIREEIERVGGEVLNEVDSVDKTAKYFAVKVDAGKIAEMAADDDVAMIFQRGVVYPTLDVSVPLIKADAFWNVGYTGSGVRVAVLDTGIDKNHPMLQGKVAAERDFTSSGSVSDDCGHGTHVAGIVAGSKASGGTYNGVAPDAQLLNAKVILKTPDGKCSGKVDYIIAAIGWALDPDGNPATDDGARVISMSLGGKGETSPSLESELKAAVEKGSVVVVSSGNCGSGCPSFDCGSFEGVTWPGNSPSVITVGAVNDSKNVACFSSGENIQNVGIKPDFTAPGVDIKSSYAGGSYASLSGTSMAAPHVSGAVALMLNKNPQLKQDDVKRILEKTSLDLGDIGKDTSYGFGLIDMAKALIYKDGLEFVIGLEKQVINGETQRINVTVYDDVQVNGVKATITKPNGAKSAEVTFASIGGNTYSYDYADTALMGNYMVDVAVNYGGTGGSSGAGSETGGEPGSGTSKSASITVIRAAYFKVTSLTGDFGNVEQINISQQQFLSQNLTSNITFANTATVDLNFSALLQLLQTTNGAIAATPSQEIRLPTLTIAANSEMAAAADNVLEVGPGNYTLRILTDYGAGSLVNETNITVIDDLPPEIVNISYAGQLESSSSPQAFVVTLLEHSNLPEVSAVVSAGGSAVNVEYASRLLHEAGDVKDVALTVFGGLSDNTAYEAVMRFCDDYGNCAESGALQFSVGSCNGNKRLLVAKTYEQSSAFEQAAAGISGLCLSVLNRSISSTPPNSYLEKFDAVVWTTDTDIANIDDNDAAALVDYYSKKGKVVVEGSDVAFRHGSDDFMHSVLHSELKTDLGFTVASVENMSNLSINLTRPHPVVAGLATPVFFNATVDPFPDAVLPYNGSAELAAWDGLDTTGAAMVVYESEDGSFKSLFLPFSIDALNEGVAESIAASSLAWLLGEAGMDIRPVRLSHGFIVEGQIAATVIIQSSEQLQTAPVVDVFADGELVSSGLLDIASPPQLQPWEYVYPFEAALGPGQHTIAVVANSGFSIDESNYVNNLGEYGLAVYPKEADLLLSGMAYSYDDELGAIIVDLNISDFGGTAAAASGVNVYLNDEQAASQSVQLTAGETKQLRFELQSQKGVYQFKAVVDADNAVAEYNESNNELAEKVYICSREKILVVDDNDAELFSTPEPSSADEFMEILRNSGYCAESWDETQQGVPGSSELNNFEVVVWSAGDYFNGTISHEDELAIGNYSGGLLIEGSDVGLDHSGSAFLEELAAAVFSSDLLLNESQNESLVLKGHPITANISSVSINKEKSPYPDSLEAVDAEVVAEWQNTNGTAAITARESPSLVELQATSYKSPYKTAYYAFSIDGVTDQAAMERLVLNTVAWLLERPNSPPQISNLSNLTVDEGGNATATVNATDLDGDSLVYNATGLPEGATFNNATATFAWAPSFDQSGFYTVTATVSDGRNSSQGAINITVTNTNRPPLLGPLQDVTGFENSTIVIAANATDPDNENAVANDDNSLAFAINDSRFSQNNGTFSFSAGFDDAGVFVVAVNVTDGSLTDSQEVVVEVLNVNRAPWFENVTNQTVLENSTLKFFANATDPDGDSLLFRMEVPPALAAAKFSSSNMELEWLPTFDDSGTYAVKFIANDTQYTTTAEINVTVLNVNRPPQIGLILVDPPGLVMGEGETKTFTASVNDADDDEVRVAWKVDGETVSTGPQLVFNTEYNDSGTYGIELVASDYASFSTAQMTLTVQDTLECGTGQTKPCIMQQGVCASSFETCAAPGHWLGCGASNYGSSYVAEEKFCLNEPNVNSCYALCDSLDNDCDGGVDEERACNTAPLLQHIGNRTVKENETLEFTVSATDAESDALALSASDLPAGAVFDTSRDTSTGNSMRRFSWVPDFEQAGSYSLQFTASDGLLTDDTTVNVTVVNTNRAPEVNITLEPPGVHMNEGDFKLLKANASDPDDDDLSYKWFRRNKLVSIANFYYFYANTTDGDENTAHMVTLEVSDGNITANATVEIVVSNTRLCKIKEIETAPCGSNIGMCRQGTRTRPCGDGYVWEDWGECVGEVKPVAEDCGTWEDDDCDGKVNEKCQPDLAAAWMSFKVADFTSSSSGEVSMLALDNASPSMRILYYGEIMNTGKNASPPSLAVWYLNDRFFGRGFLPRVDAGEKVPVQMMTLVPYQGGNVAQLVLDADGRIAETYENNNDIDFNVDVNYNETYKEFAKKFAESYYARFPTKEECETQQGRCWK
ncbi:S8 family serine peptidase [Candidatus Woesearchaeota archaeon]|nr:S8 family serine peptidase [Candidatus Woesearchaeota archaeon]